MLLLAAGHKRTGACPTFDRPVLQRDGHLVRVPLVGGAISSAQVRAVARVAAVHGNATIELTNRGNLQVRGIHEAALDSALAALRTEGLGHPDAALVTISPFAGAREHDLRQALLVALHLALAAGPPLAPKFVVHVDDIGGATAARRAEVVLGADGGDWCVRIDGVGQRSMTAPEAIATVLALADACRDQGPQARVADLVTAGGTARVRGVIPFPDARWRAIEPARPATSARLGLGIDRDGLTWVSAAARLGRVGPDVLVGLADLLDHTPAAALHVTPWRSFGLALPTSGHATTSVVLALAGLGLIVSDLDPAAGVVACIGVQGCWQTEADTLAEAERQIAHRVAGAGSLHVTGCDKRCATRAPTAVTLLGRPDGTGWDEVSVP